MSGGALDYSYRKIELAIEDFEGLLKEYPDENTELRQEFIEHLKIVAEALRAVEWNLSGDGDDREESLILKTLSRNSI